MLKKSIINRFSAEDKKYPVNNWINDIFGAGITLETSDIEKIEKLLDEWKVSYNLKKLIQKSKIFTHSV